MSVDAAGIAAEAASPEELANRGRRKSAAEDRRKRLTLLLMVRVPTLAEEDAKRPNRERGCPVKERTRLDGISGTSAGAMNAAVLSDGHGCT